MSSRRLVRFVMSELRKLANWGRFTPLVPLVLVTISFAIPGAAVLLSGITANFFANSSLNNKPIDLVDPPQSMAAGPVGSDERITALAPSGTLVNDRDGSGDRTDGGQQ